MECSSITDTLYFLGRTRSCQVPKLRSLENLWLLSTFGYHMKQGWAGFCNWGAVVSNCALMSMLSPEQRRKRKKKRLCYSGLNSQLLTLRFPVSCSIAQITSVNVLASQRVSPMSDDSKKVASMAGQ